MRVRFCFVLIAALSVSIFLPALQGQTSNGTVTGTVTDKSGGAVTNAAVKVISLDRGGESHATNTDAAGAYRVSSLLPGRYKVSIEAPGFGAMVINDLEVRASLETNASAVLELSAVTSTVTVEANVGQELQTQSGELSGNLSTAEVVNLPYFSGNPLELLLTEPGVQESSARDAFTSNGIGFTANGARPRGNNFLLDGQDNNDSQITGQAVQTVNHEAIGEVTVILNSSSAEFGRGGGAIANEVYKGGTNNWHGSGWDIVQPSKLAAIDAGYAFFNPGAKQPVQITNTFGFSLGGPIKKNKLFFFATPQWSRFRANAGVFTTPDLIPTANGVAALQQIETNEGPNANIDYLIASLGSLRGTSNGAQLVSAGFDAQGNPRPAVEFGTLSRGDTSIVSNSLQWSVRLDYLASDHDQFTLRALRGNSTFTPDFFNNPHELPAFETQQDGPFSNYHAAWVHTVSSKMVNELRFSYGSIQFEFTPTPATLASPIGTHFTVDLQDLPNPDGTAMEFGLPGNEPSSRDHQTYQFQDAFSWSFGKHTLKFGGDMALVFATDGIPVDPRGTIVFFPTKNKTCYNIPGTANPTDCSSLTNYIDNFSGPSGNISKFFGNTRIHPFLPNYAPYIQDSWRIRQNFTLDLGLRYEYWGIPGNNLQYPSLDSRFGQGLAGATFPAAFAAQQQPDKNNFAPRVGLAYTPHFLPRIFGGDKTVIRAGYGIFYDGLFTNILDNTASGSPNGIAQNIVGPGPDPANQRPFSRGTPNATGVLASLQPVLTPFAFVDTMSSHLLNPLTHQWNFNIERQLPAGFLLTTAYVGTRGEHLFVNTDENPFFNNPNFGAVTARTNGGDSIYHAGELKLQRSFSHGLLVSAGYTYSKFLDDMSDVFITSGSSSYPQDVFNQHGDRGPSSYDHRHRLALAYLYELPYVHRSDNVGFAVLRAITNGWQTSGRITFSTGAPQTFYDGFDNNGDTHGNDRPFLGNLKVPINYSTACLNPAGTCDSGVGFTLDGTTFVDFNSSFGFDPNTGNFTATKNDFRYYVYFGKNGDIGRNTFSSPGFQSWNLSVQRTVKLKERYAFMVRGEFYNAFNHPNLGIPSLNLASTFFDNTAATITGARTIVLWGKFSF